MTKEVRYSSRKKRRRRVGCALLVAFVLLLGVLVAGVGMLLRQIDKGFQHDSSVKGLSDDDLSVAQMPDTPGGKEVINIALFGVDSRSKTSFKGLSDSIMIISIDEVHNKIKLVSVMRDTLVQLPGGRGYAKINAAFDRGGAELAIKTLNQSFNLNIRDYAVINFVGMADIIDALGGLEVNVTEQERQNANIHISYMAQEVGTSKTPIQKAGRQTLTGAQAVAWARIRKVPTADGVADDYGRTDRQRYVMEQLFNKALNAGVTKYPALIKSLLPYLQTSLTYGQILDYASTVLIGGVTFEQSRVPLADYQIDGDFRDRTGDSAVYYNLAYAGKVIRAFFYDDIPPETYVKQYGVDKTRWAG